MERLESFWRKFSGLLWLLLFVAMLVFVVWLTSKINERADELRYKRPVVSSYAAPRWAAFFISTQQRIYFYCRAELIFAGIEQGGGLFFCPRDQTRQLLCRVRGLFFQNNPITDLEAEFFESAGIYFQDSIDRVGRGVGR